MKMALKTEYGKCLETGKQQNPLWSTNVTDRGAPTDLLDVYLFIYGTFHVNISMKQGLATFTTNHDF